MELKGREMDKYEFVTNRILHGGDYNPEQWLDRPDILQTDIEYLKKADCNTVTLGVFSWASIEREEGLFDFSWLSDVIDELYRNGIQVILATPSGAKPRWLAMKYPEVLRTNINRDRNLYGGRHNHCFTSPVYREKVRIINRKLADRFGSHPAVKLWHISNEYNGECHCELCQQAFRNWLRNRYGSIDEVNRRWCTSFWGHNYNSFDQIESPSPLGDMGFNGLNLDWKRFVTYQTLDFAKAEIAAIRESGSLLPVTTNLMYFFNSINYQEFGSVFDILSWDNYPSWHRGEEIETAWDSGLYHDIVRGIQRKPFLIMESCPSATNWKPVGRLKRPGVQVLCSMQAVAHGSDSVLYFQIRQSEGAFEKFHGAVIDHYGGDDTRVFGEVKKTGEALTRLDDVAGTTVVSTVAIIYDWESNWAMDGSAGPRNQGLHFKEAVLKHYKALRKQGLNVDVIAQDRDIDSYDLIVIPMLYMFKPGFAGRVRAFAASGKTVVMTYWSGIADENDRCFLGGTPHDLMDVFGIRQMEIDALYDGEMNHVSPAAELSWLNKEQYECRYLCELVETTTAKPLLYYRDDFYAGSPAVTQNTYGSGEAYYLSADFEDDFYSDLYGFLIRQKGIMPIVEHLPAGVTVTSRENGEHRFIFLQNFTEQTVTMSKDDLPDVRGITIGAFDTRIVRCGV